MWKLKKCDFKLPKCHLDVSFSLDCKKNGVILEFLPFKLDTLQISLCARSAKSDCWKKKSFPRESGLISWKRMHKVLKKYHKEHFLF